MSTEKLGVIGCALCVFILLALVAAGFQSGLFSNAGISCQEDMACWDCTTMGNRICGVPR